jgi:hypothetical protein
MRPTLREDIFQNIPGADTKIKLQLMQVIDTLKKINSLVDLSENAPMSNYQISLLAQETLKQVGELN